VGGRGTGHCAEFWGIWSVCGEFVVNVSVVIVCVGRVGCSMRRVWCVWFCTTVVCGYCVGSVCAFWEDGLYLG